MTRPSAFLISSASGEAIRLRVAFSYSLLSAKLSLSYHALFACAVASVAPFWSAVKLGALVAPDVLAAHPGRATLANTPAPASAIPPKNSRRPRCSWLQVSHMVYTFRSEGPRRARSAA